MKEDLLKDFKKNSSFHENEKKISGNIDIDKKINTMYSEIGRLNELLKIKVEENDNLKLECSRVHLKLKDVIDSQEKKILHDITMEYSKSPSRKEEYES